MLLAVAALVVQCNDVLLDHAASSAISRIDGLLLLLFFSVFLVYAMQVIVDEEADGPSERPPLSAKSVALFGLGLGMVIVGARWVVNGAVGLAEILNVSKRFVGLTVVAFGTSLLELTTSAVAAYRKNAGIAVGNVVGSNIFNVFLVLGASACAAPLPCCPGLNADLAVMALASVLLFLAMFFGKPRHQVQRVEGILFLVLYVGYVAWLIKRG